MSLDKVTLVMIGGVACDETLWDAQVSALKDIADCRPVMAQGASIEAMADAILARFDGPIAVVGHSMGGYVALAVQRMAAGRVTRLALIGSGANVEQPAQRETRLALMDLVRKKSFEAMLDRLVPAMVGPQTRRNGPMMARLEAMVRRTGGERFLREQGAVMGRPEAQAALGEITVPVLVVAGRDDRIVPPVLGEETARKIASADFCLLAHCGHIAPVERAEAICALLRNWLLQPDGDQIA